MLIPSVVAYGLIPFWAGIWEKIYFKFYELGNNGFYISSPGDDAEDGDEPEATNVEIK